jgi:hypothetical protein
MRVHPISIKFGIKQVGQEIKDFTRSDINKYKSSFDPEASDC